MSLEAEIKAPIARVKYPEVKTFNEFIGSLSKILDESRFTLTSEGLKIVGMDPARVAYIEINIPRDAFLEYEMRRGEETVEAGFNLNVLKDILEGKKGNPVEITITQDKILVAVEGTVGRRFLLPNLEISVEALEGIQLEHDVRAVLIGDVLKRAVADIKTVSDTLEIEADEDRLLLKSSEETSSKAFLRLTSESSALLGLEVRRPSKARYDISYLDNVLNLVKIAETIELLFSTDKPLELNFRSPDGSTAGYILAPIVS